MFASRLFTGRGSWALALFLLAPSPWAHAQGAADEHPAAVGEPDDFLLRTYEVGDLVVNVTDYAFGPSDGSAQPAGFGGGGGGGMGGGGGGFFSVPDDVERADLSSPRGQHPDVIMAQFGGDRGGGGRGGGRGGRGPIVARDPLQISFDSLIDAMTKVVAPDTWQENGTGQGDVRVVGAALVVWQTQDVHDGIADFLNQLRQGSARRRTVAIDARWLLLNSDDLDRLNPPNDDGEPAVDRRVLAELTRRPTSLRGLTNCVSGQAVYLISGTRRTVVSGYIPVVGSVEAPEADAMWAEAAGRPRIIFAQIGGESGAAVGGRSVGYQPIVEKPNFGALLQIRPTLMQGQDAAVVDVMSTITFGAADADVGDAPAAPRIDRMAIDQQELATTLRVPLGEPTLVGGMSYIGENGAIAKAPAADAATADDATGGETPQLYLVLEIR